MEPPTFLAHHTFLPIANETSRLLCTSPSTSDVPGRHTESPASVQILRATT